MSTSTTPPTDLRALEAVAKDARDKHQMARKERDFGQLQTSNGFEMGEFHRS